MSKRWDEDNDDFEFAGGNPEDEFWAEYTGDGDENEPMPPDIDAFSAQFREQELEIADKHLNTELLDRAIGIAKSSMFWYFWNLSTKLQAVKEAYRSLLKLVVARD